uniref:Uncharacterized protein n=1 Tax=Acrobeloides nanus TaxID=290746 RepID=A0A914CSI7_9BILA
MVIQRVGHVIYKVKLNKIGIATRHINQLKPRASADSGDDQPFRELLEAYELPFSKAPTQFKQISQSTDLEVSPIQKTCVQFHAHSPKFEDQLHLDNNDDLPEIVNAPGSTTQLRDNMNLMLHLTEVLMMRPILFGLFNLC